MVIVSPVLTFDIGAVASDDPSDIAYVNSSIKKATKYVNELITPDFKEFMEQVAELQQDYEEDIEFDIGKCLDCLDSCLDFEDGLKAFNNDYGDTFVFFDSIYLCRLVGNKLYLNDERGSKEYNYIMSHKETINKIRRTINAKYNNLEEQYIIFANFFIVMRDRPFMRTLVFVDDNGEMIMIK